MKKTWLVVAGIAVLVAVLFVLPFKNSNPVVEHEVKARTVKIEIIDMLGFSHAQGTGTLMGGNRILTCAHLLEGRPLVPLIMFRGYYSAAYRPAVVVSSDTAKDFMILKFIGTDKTPELQLQPNWKMNERVFIIGNPGFPDFDNGYTNLIGMMYVRSFPVAIRAVLLLPCGVGRPGFSGSGVFNMKGELVGIFELSTGLGICGAIPAHDVVEWLKEKR